MELDTPSLPPPSLDPPAPERTNTPTRPAPSERPPGAIIGGVCATISARMGIDPLWVRIAFVVLGLASGLGLIIYLGAWLAFVLGPAQHSSLLRGLGGAILIGFVPLTIVNGDTRFVSGPAAVIGLLGGLALALWQSERPTTSPTAWYPPATFDTRIDTGIDDAIDGRARRVHTVRPHSLLGRGVLGAAIVVAAAGWLIDQANGGRLHPEQWLGAAAGVCGIGMLIGTVRGHARWLVLPAVALAGVGFVWGELARLGIDADHVGGDQYFSIDTGEANGVRTHAVESGFGDAYIDMQQAPAIAHRVNAALAFGDIWITVPSDVAVEIRPHLAHGDVTVSGERRNVDVIHVGPEGAALLVVDARLGYGDIHVDVFEPPTADQSLDGAFDEFDGVQYDEFGNPFPVPTVGPADAVGVGQLIQIDQYLSGTGDGYIVLMQGEAVIDPSDRIVSSQIPTTPLFDIDGSEGTAIDTSFGQFRLLPRSLLLTPDLHVIDLRDVRAHLAAPTADSATTVPPVLTQPDAPTPPLAPLPTSSVGA